MRCTATDRKAAGIKETPSQTAGPYVPIGLMPQVCGVSPPAQLGALAPTGEHPIDITGSVSAGAGAPVTDALIEIWRADEAGSSATKGHTCRQRVPSDVETGQWHIKTGMPKAAPGAAPHLTVWILERSINIALQARMSFPHDAPDAVLQSLPDMHRPTLIAQQDGEHPAR